jgi:hypothetical protein
MQPLAFNQERTAMICGRLPGQIPEPARAQTVVVLSDIPCCYFQERKAMDSRIHAFPLQFATNSAGHRFVQKNCKA